MGLCSRQDSLAAVEYYLDPKNAQNTLYCLAYRKLHNPTRDMEVPTTLNIRRRILKFIDVVEGSREIVFNERIYMTYTDPRLKFPQCSSDYKLAYNAKEILQYIWAPDIDTAVYSSTQYDSSGTKSNSGLKIKLWPVSLSPFLFRLHD